MKTEVSSPCSQETVTCPCPEPDQYSPGPVPISLRSILLSSHLPSDLFTSVFPTKSLYASHTPSVRATCPANPHLHRSLEQYLVTADRVAPHAMSSSPLFPQKMTSVFISSTHAFYCIFSKPFRAHGTPSYDSHPQNRIPLHFDCFNGFNPLKPELNPICYLLALLGAHHFLHVSRIRVKSLTFRRLSYIYIYIYIYIYMEHPFLMFLDHTQRRSTVGRTPLDE